MDLTGQSLKRARPLDVDISDDGFDNMEESEQEESRRIRLNEMANANTNAKQIKSDTDEKARRSKELKSKVMGIDLVMAKIAEGMPTGDLLPLRETCTTWNRNYIPQLKKKTPKIFLRSDLEEYIETVGASSDIPFTKYSFSPGSRPRYREYFQDFITRFGNTITRLELDWKQPAHLPLTYLRRIIFEMTPELMELSLNPEVTTISVETEVENHVVKMLPKLRTLEANVAMILVSLTDPTFIRLMADVVQCANGLERLDMHASDSGSPVEFNRSMFTALLHNSVTHVHKLKTLEFTPLQAEDLQLLIQLAGRIQDPLKIECFTTNLDSTHHNDRRTIKLFHEFLATQEPTLKRLVLHFWSDEDVLIYWHTYYIPSLEHLRHFKIIHSGLTPYKIKYKRRVEGRSMKFRDVFPQLKRFSYKNDPSVIDDLKKFYHPRVEDLEMETESTLYTNFTEFRNIFPSLTRLALILQQEDWRAGSDDDLQLDMKQIARIWTTWPALTSVSVVWKANGLDLDLDAWLSGVSRSGLEHLRHHFDFSTLQANPSMDLLHQKLDIYKSRPGISNLKELREISIIVEGKKRPRLTDMGGYFGLALASPYLQRAIIHGHGKNFVSESCLEFLGKVFGLCADIRL